MKYFTHPAAIGGLVVGIGFNVMLAGLGQLGVAFQDALYLTSSSLTLLGAVIVQWLIGRRRKGKS